MMVVYMEYTQCLKEEVLIHIPGVLYMTIECNKIQIEPSGNGKFIRIRTTEDIIHLYADDILTENAIYTV